LKPPQGLLEALRRLDTMVSHFVKRDVSVFEARFFNLSMEVTKRMPGRLPQEMQEHILTAAEGMEQVASRAAERAKLLRSIYMEIRQELATEAQEENHHAAPPEEPKKRRRAGEKKPPSGFLGQLTEDGSK